MAEECICTKVHSRTVATGNKRAAYDTSRALAKVRPAKVVHHHLVDNGVDLGAVRPVVADAILPLTCW